jgi:hypothetical protein
MLRAWGHRRDDDIAGLGRMTILWAQGRRRVDGIVGSGMAQGRQRCGLEEDDSVADSGMAWADGIIGLGMAPAWSTMSPARVREDGSPYMGLDQGQE